MENEKKNRQKGLIVSGTIHALLLILFFFIIAWREPNPPLPEYGIELNFGLDNAGSGQEQPRNPASNQEIDEPSPEQEEVEEEIQSQEVEQTESEPIEETVETVQESEPQPTENPVETYETESPDVQEKVVEEKPIKEVVKEKEKPAEKPSETKTKETKTEISSTTGNSTSEKPAGTSQGDKENETGDQGDPQGEVDARALYGKRGGGDGASLSLTGWVWDNMPKPKDTSDENGRIVFEIIVDDFGDLISVKTVEKTVSPAVERVYRSEVEKLTFSPTADNAIPAPRSKGTITFIIRSK